MSDDLELDPDEQRVADRILEAPPRPSPSLRRRVRDRISVAFVRKGLRRRSVALTSAGVVVLGASLVLALSVS